MLLSGRTWFDNSQVRLVVTVTGANAGAVVADLSQHFDSHAQKGDSKGLEAPCSVNSSPHVDICSLKSVLSPSSDKQPQMSVAGYKPIQLLN